jgi:predicted transcriptional regulator YdeE
MENKELYPKGTVKQTEDFALRQKIKKIVGENVEEIIKEETINAFEELGYEEKDGYMFVIAAGGKDGEEKEVGKGVKEGKLNVTVSTPKMLNMGAVKPVSYMQKVTTFGGKKIVSEIYLEIIDKTVHVEYKNTEASSFHQSSEKDTYAPNKLNKTGVITGLENEKTFKKDFKDFFKSIAEAEAKYLIGTKIANDDKIEKNMNDSIVKENKYNMKLSDLLSSSFEDAGGENKQG